MARKTGHLFTPKRAKNLVGVAKVVAPALIPVLAPVLARGAGMLSEQYDRYRANVRRWLPRLTPWSAV